MKAANRNEQSLSAASGETLPQSRKHFTDLAKFRVVILLSVIALIIVFITSLATGQYGVSFGDEAFDAA